MRVSCEASALATSPVELRTIRYAGSVRVFVSGHGPLKADKTLITGRVGETLTLDQGKDAARQVGLAVLATVKDTLGSLDKVKRVVKLLGMVNSAPGFSGQPQVIHGCSDLLVQVFGEAGRHARAAVGAPALPMGVAVEVDAVVAIRR